MSPLDKASAARADAEQKLKETIEKAAEIGNLADRIEALADRIDIATDKLFNNTPTAQV